LAKAAQTKQCFFVFDTHFVHKNGTYNVLILTE